MTSIVQFISGPVFDAADIQLMSDAYDKAIEDVHRFGRPNAIVEEIMETHVRPFFRTPPARPIPSIFTGGYD